MNYQLINTLSGLKSISDKLSSAPIIALDTETTGIEWWKHSVFMISLSTGVDTYVIDTRELYLKDIQGFLNGLLHNSEGQLIGHNLKFDMHHLKSSFDVEISCNINDTQVMAHLLNENRSKGLKNLMHEDLNIRHPEKNNIKDWLKSNFKKQSEYRYDKIPIQIIAPYAAWDAWGTYTLYQQYLPLIRTYFPSLYKTEMKVIRILYKMEQNGVRIDVPYLEELERTYTGNINNLEHLMLQQYGNINFNSSKQIRNILFDVYNLPILNRSPKTGQPSTDAAVLKLYDHPFVADLLHYRKLKKIQSTYIKSLLRCHNKGVVHGNYNITGTETGRFSCSAPNLQNQSKEKDIKEAYLPDVGHKMVFWDQSQIEMVGFAHYAKEPKMQAIFKRGEDLYKATAAEVLSIPMSEVTKHQRQVLKNMNLAMIYGVGEKKLSNFLNMNLDNKVSHSQAVTFRKCYLDKFSGISMFMKHVMQTVKTYRLPWGHYVKNEFGRVRRIELDKAYTGVNHLIQGWAADLMKASMVRIEEKFKPNWKQNIHDAIRIDVPIDMADYQDYVREVSKCLTEWPEVSVPIRVKVESSDQNWAEVK